MFFLSSYLPPSPFFSLPRYNQGKYITEFQIRKSSSILWRFAFLQLYISNSATPSFSFNRAGSFFVFHWLCGIFYCFYIEMVFRFLVNVFHKKKKNRSRFVQIFGHPKNYEIRLLNIFFLKKKIFFSNLHFSSFMESCMENFSFFHFSTKFIFQGK